MTDSLTQHLAEEVAQLLPSALHEEALIALAERLRPLIDAADRKTPAPQLLTTAEAAARARVNVETIRRAIRSGALPAAAVIGRSPRIADVALAAWLTDTATRRVPARQASPPASRRRTAPAEGSLRAAWRKF